MRMKFFSLLFLIGLFAGPKARAQIDPTLTGMIYAYAENYCYMAAPREMRRLMQAQGVFTKSPT